MLDHWFPQGLSPLAAEKTQLKPCQLLLHALETPPSHSWVPTHLGNLGR